MKKMEHEKVAGDMPKIEVFTPPPHSTWSLHGVYIIPHRLHVDSMEYVLAVIPLILGSPFHLDSTWNDDGMAKFHME